MNSMLTQEKTAEDIVKSKLKALPITGHGGL
jgi:hypothetical protein